MSPLPIKVNWITVYPEGGLLALNENTIGRIGSVLGVYLIYQPGNSLVGGRHIRVGQGDVAARLTAHRKDPQIAVYGSFGPLCFTFAPLPSSLLNGCEAYLAKYYRPLVGERFPDVVPIPMTVPLAA